MEKLRKIILKEASPLNGKQMKEIFFFIYYSGSGDYTRCKKKVCSVNSDCPGNETCVSWEDCSPDKKHCF